MDAAKHSHGREHHHHAAPAAAPQPGGVLYPVTGWLLSPMIAALAMSLNSASVIGNALRLRGRTA